jgi:diguanylate cyclase (GGDEF)-like protein
MDLAGYKIQEVIYAVDDTVVARARSERGDKVVLKYQDSNRPSPDLLARWQHEYAVLKSIDSEWVVKTLGLKQVEHSLILVLEDFASTNLAQLIARQPLDLSEKLTLALQFAQAVSAVHAHGLIHGDVSPKNALVDVAGMKLKLCDFGLSSRLDHGQKVVQEAALRGTLEYMSPEQTGRTNLDVDYRSDLYSLGVSLYELFAGKKPFQSPDPMTLLHAQIAVMPPPLHEVDRNIPEPLSLVVQKLLSKYPDDRYQSSFGLIADLKRCAQQWQRSRRMEAFPLASADIPERFCVAQRLYGREIECARILGAFERASQGYAELLLIRGYSGIGKTAVVGELHRPVVARRGYFLRGKCDQYSRNQPYAALCQAFQQLLRQLVVEGEERRAYWKSRLREALGENAGAIAEILPDLRELIGEPPRLPPLPAAEKENRFHIAFSQFVNALASTSHPLMLFLDDLQWADAPTLRLLEHLVRDDTERCVLVVGAYRDNEVDETHPLQQAIHAIRNANGHLEILQLENLGLAHVRRLIADTLHCEEPVVASLAELCMEKTQGNPFFLGQLLRSLHEQGEIHYERAEGCWDWDIEDIRRRGITDNVVVLMLQKLRTLDARTQDVLALAAHLGTTFDLRQLTAVAGLDVVSTAVALWPALQAGLVIPLNENYKFDHSPAQLQAARYRFLHDRVQQAAYDLTRPEDRLPLQLRCGRLLLAGSSEAELEERLFNVLGSLNAAAMLITDPAERARLLALNVRGGMRAKSSSALAPAVTLLRQAKLLLAADAWQAQPEQTLLLYRELAEAEYLAGNFAAADALYPEAVAAAPDPIAKVQLLLVQVDQYHIQGRFAEAFPVLRDALDLLGQPFPATEEEAGLRFMEEFAQSEAMLAEHSHAELLAADEMTDQARLLEMRVYFGIAYCTYQIRCFNAYVLNATRMVRTTLLHGQCDLSCIAYVTYVTAMSAMKQPYPRCYDQGKLAMTLAEKREDRYFRLSVYQYFCAFYQHWCEPLANGIPYLDQGVEMGQAGINPLAAGFCVLLRAANRFAQGAPLDTLHLECERGLKFLQQSHQGSIEAMLLYGILLPLLALRGQTLSPTSFDTASASASEFFRDGFAVPSIPLAFHIGSVARHAYLLDDAPQWRQCADNLAVVGMCLPDSPSLVEASFYTALGLLKTGFGEPENRDADVAAATAHLELFRTWAAGCPANFHHKALLIEAELARVRGDDAAAMDLYAQAIDAAGAAGFTACEALANELYARFWLARKQRQLSSNFIRDAWYHYRRWGAEVKCRQLEAQWPEVSFRSLERTHTGAVSTQSQSYRSISEHTGLLDLHSLLKTTQFLAKEIQLESLLPKMLGVLLENAGAEHGAIILVDDEQLIVEAAGGMSDGRHFDCHLISRPLADLCRGGRPSLPTAVIEYVQLTRATLLLNNPASDARFGQNTYLQQRQPKSMLCLPVHTQGKLVALVYMENNLMENAFTPRHQQTLELLSSQAAISLVNARLYESLERKVMARTEELRQMSMKDGLTGIANRRSFDERLAVELRRGLRSQAPLSLLMMDIDHFKQYNDHFGHFQGDDCIRAVAATLAGVVSRAGDLVARYGGEEFAILLPETDADAAVQVAESCLLAIASLGLPHANSPASDLVSVSIGVCTLAVSPETTPAMLITRADQALYEAKRAGRNRYVQFFAPAQEDPVTS